MLRMNFPGRRQKRHEEAQERQVTYDALSLQEKLRRALSWSDESREVKKLQALIAKPSAAKSEKKLKKVKKVKKDRRANK